MHGNKRYSRVVCVFADSPNFQLIKNSIGLVCLTGIRNRWHVTCSV